MKNREEIYLKCTEADKNGPTKWEIQQKPQIEIVEKPDIWPRRSTKKVITDYYMLRAICDNLNDGYDEKCFESVDDYYKWIQLLSDEAYNIKVWCKRILDKKE